MYLGKNQWLPTWNGEDAALKIGQIKIWQRGDGSEAIQQTFSDKVKSRISKTSTKIHPMFDEKKTEN